MAMTACPRCTQSYPDDQLIPVGNQRICLNCEAELEDTKKMRSGVHRSIVSLPIIGLTSFVVLCIPYVGPFVSVLLAAFAGIVGIQGIRLGMSVRQDPGEYGVGTTEPILLIVFGVITLVWGLVLTGIDLLLIAALIWASSGV